MAGSFYNNKDSVDISELAALNEDISDDLIDQLQKKITDNLPVQSADINTSDDSTLFEEPSTLENNSETIIPEAANTESPLPEGTDRIEAHTDTQEEAQPEKKQEVNQNFDDNFIKKYKAKLQKKAQGVVDNSAAQSDSQDVINSEAAAEETQPIENLSQGNITEKPITKELKEYNDSLDFIDGNVKYSKYVIYIDPQNVDFIDGLTVKERKNLINNILHQQDDISMTKQRFKVIQTVIYHIIIAIVTIAISIPLVYYLINASLEATINNHRNAQGNWQTLYREHGKINNGIK